MKSKISRLLLLVISYMFIFNVSEAKASTHWEVNPHEFQYDMTMYLSVDFKYAPMDYSKYEIGAFVGDQCRGVAEILDIDGLARPVLYMRVRSNVQEGETVTFKYMNLDTDEINDIANVSVPFVANTRVGMPSNPYKIIIERYYQVNIEVGDVKGGTVSPESGEYCEGTELNVSATASEGHTFVKWSDGVTENPRVVTVDSNITLIAEFEVNSYKLTYMIGEEVISESEVLYGTALTAIEAPAKEGHTFAGWQGLPETMPAHDVTVTGSYTVNSYKLTFKIGEEIISEEMVLYGSEIVEPQAPAKEGHTFDGWAEHPATMPASDLTVTGTYTVNKYKLTYMIGEEVISESEIDYGTALVAIEAPAKEGHTFAGWEGLPETMPAEDVTVTGSYSINSYKLTFVIGEEVISETILEYGAEIVEPEAPEKVGHTFAGWSEHPATMPASDLTVTGTYTVNKYKLTYMIGEEVISESEIDYGTALVAIEAPAKEGHTFAGWEGLPETMPAHDVTVTGSYTVNSYKLTFKIGEDVISEEMVLYGSEIVEPQAPAKEGHTFDGWAEHPATMPASDLTVTGTYTVNQYKLTYIIEEEVISETMLDYGTVLVAIEAPAKEGYTFNGWEGLPETMPAEDVTVTGSYSINSYKLTFVIGEEVISEAILEYGAEIVEPEAPEKVGHTFAGWSEHPATMPATDLTVTGTYTVNQYKLTYMIEEEVISETMVDYGTALVAIEAPAKEGYTFNGWEGLPETMPAEDVTVTGSYSINSYKLTFVIGEEVISEAILEYGAEIVEPEAPEKVGYTFAGWSEHPATMPASDLTVTGTYTVNKYKLTYMIEEEVISESMVDYGTTLVAIEAPAKEGYTFNGWEGLPETMPAEDVTVTGSYTINTYTLTFILDGEVYSETTVTYGEPIVEPEVEEREGYEFSGWSEHPELMPANDLTITGSFEAITYSIFYYVDGELYYTDYAQFGETITPIPEPEQEGYIFSGWSEMPETMPAHDITVEGSFEKSSVMMLMDMDIDVEHMYIYDLQGHVIARDAKANTLEHLSGLYIINGKKVKLP